MTGSSGMALLFLLLAINFLVANAMTTGHSNSLKTPGKGVETQRISSVGVNEVESLDTHQPDGNEKILLQHVSTAMSLKLPHTLERKLKF